MARFSRRANVIAGVLGVLFLGLVGSAVIPGFFVVRSSPCKMVLHQIAQAQRGLYADHDRYTDRFAELEGVVLEPQSTYALDAGHPSGLPNTCPDCLFVATCRANTPERDVWSVSSVERTFRGETVPAFSLLHDFSPND